MRTDEIEHAASVAEVSALFDAYERALLANRIDSLEAAFWADERTVRFGISEVQWGSAAISEWRRESPGVPSTRRIIDRRVQSFGPDVVAVDVTFCNGDDPGLGRQSQTWVRVDGQWAVVRAHVSMID
jgi:Protein of unknown function (DUF3225)